MNEILDVFKQRLANAEEKIIQGRIEKMNGRGSCYSKHIEHFPFVFFHTTFHPLTQIVDPCCFHCGTSGLEPHSRQQGRSQ